MSTAERVRNTYQKVSLIEFEKKYYENSYYYFDNENQI